MAPLVIILPTVVVVIVLAVALGLRHIKKNERADLAGDRPAGRIRGRPASGQDDEWRAPRQRPSAPRPAARIPAAGRPAREDHPKQRSPQPGRGDEEAEVVQLRGRPDPRGKQGKGSKRSGDDGDWPSTEWDDLSDADYWKEVASDRPLVTTARTAAPESPAPRPDQASLPDADVLPVLSSRAARQAQDAQTLLQAAAAPQRGQEPRRGDQEPRRRGWGSRRDRASRDAGLPDHSAAPAPSMGRPQRAAAAAAGPAYGSDYLGAPPPSPALDLPRPQYRPDPGPAMPTPGMPGPAMPAAAGLAPAARPRTAPAPLDDDPLTSPSFPRIVTSDSRSYRSSRSASGAPAAPAAAAPAADRASYSSATTAVFPRYGSPATHAAGAEPGGYDSGGYSSGSYDSGGYSLGSYDSGGYSSGSYEPAGYPSAASGVAPHSYPTGESYTTGEHYTPGESYTTGENYTPGDSYATGDSYTSGSHAVPSHQPSGYHPTPLDASYSLPSQPVSSYDSSPGMVNGYGPGGPGTGHSPAQDTTAAYASPQPARYPGPEPASAPAPAGNPYGSYVSSSDYVSTDLPGYTPSLAAAYPPGQPASSYLPTPAAPRSSDPYAQDYPPAAATDSWYPTEVAGGRPTGSIGSHRGPAGGAEPASAGYAAAAEYGQPSYSGRHHDAPSYIPAGYDGPGSAPGYLPSGGHPAGQQDTAAYLPPDYYGRDGREDQARW